MSTTTTRRTILPDDILLGDCRRCGGINFTLTATRRIPVHKVDGWKPDRPLCAGAGLHPVTGTVQPETFSRYASVYAPGSPLVA